MDRINKTIALIKQNQHILKIVAADSKISSALLLQLLLSEVYNVHIPLEEAKLILEVV